MTTLYEALYEKLRDELASYKDEVAQMEPYEIISKARSIAIRENIVDAASASAYNANHIEPGKATDLLQVDNLLGHMADVYAACDQNPILFNVNQIGTLDEILEDVYQSFPEFQKETARPEVLNKYTVEYKINAGYDVPVPANMDANDLSDSDILDILSHGIDFDIGYAEYDDRSEPDLIKNDDGSYDLHVRIYATYFTDIYAFSEEEAKTLAEEKVQEADFGELTSDEEFQYELSAVDKELTDSMKLAHTIIEAVRDLEADAHTGCNRFFAPNIDNTNCALLVKIEDAKNITIDVYESLDTFYEHPFAAIGTTGSEYYKNANDILTHSRKLGSIETEVDLIQMTMNDFVVSEMGLGERESTFRTAPKPQKQTDLDR